MKRFLLTAAILALSANAAVAADALPPSDYDWSGFSAGVFGGGQWSSFDETELHTDAFGGGWWFPPGPNPGFDYNDSAAMFGVQAGFDRQFDRLVLGLGLEAMAPGQDRVCLVTTKNPGSFNDTDVSRTKWLPRKAAEKQASKQPDTLRVFDYTNDPLVTGGTYASAEALCKTHFS